MKMATRKLIARHYNRGAEAMSGFSRYFGNKADDNVDHVKAIEDIETTIGQLSLIRALIESDRDGTRMPKEPEAQPKTDDSQIDRQPDENPQ